MHFVYVLRSEVDGKFNVGMSTDVQKRLKEHNAGKTKSTKGYTPWILFFFEELETRDNARTREIYLKSGVGREFIKRKWTGSSVG